MNEHDILHIIAENPSINQRKIAEKAKISLGQANFLIKKCVKKGLVKIEGQSPKSLQYNLTPKGIKEKAELTLKYIKLSYAAVVKLADKVAEIAKDYIDHNIEIYIIDSKDEMTQIVKIGLEKAGEEYQVIKDVSEIDFSSEYILLIWEEDETLINKDIKYLNILL